MGTNGDRRVTRRRFLAALGATGTLAGCTDLLPPSDGTPQSPTPRPDTAADAATPARTPAAPGDAYRRVYEETVNAVAGIRTDDGSGTAWVYDAAGTLVTNAHVVGAVGRPTVVYRRGEFRRGRVLGTDVYSDLAVVGVPNPPRYATPIPLADGTPAVGTRVVVIGNPYGLDSTLSAGVVSGVNRSLPSPTGFSIPGAIQTDAAVNPGNSGGPLLDLTGEVIAVINSGGGENIAFGVPTPLLRRVVPALIETGEYDHPYMGVRLQEVTPAVARDRDRETTHGVLVVEVVTDAPAAGALRADDIILGLDGDSIRTTDDLSRHLAFETAPGDRLRVTVARGSRRETVSFTLGTRPDP